MNQIPGIKAVHAIITPHCRRTRGIAKSLQDAISRIEAEYYDCMTPENIQEGVVFHVALFVERPDESPH